MQKGSLIVLAKKIPWGDYRVAEEQGVSLPEKEVIYTVSYGPALSFDYKQKRSRLAIQIEELGSTNFDPAYFAEVQPPMKVDLEEILVTKNHSA